MVENKMKNDIKFLIPDKFLVDLEFKKKLRLFDICSIDELTAVIVEYVFSFSEMSDQEMADYYINIEKVNRHDKAVKIGSASFELYDLKYSYSYHDNKLYLDCDLFYKSPEELYNGKGKFSVNFTTVCKVPGESSEALRFCESKLSLNIKGQITNFSHCNSLNVLNTATPIAFNDDRCNKEMPENIRICTDPSTATKVADNTFDKDDLYKTILNKINRRSLA